MPARTGSSIENALPAPTSLVTVIRYPLAVPVHDTKSLSENWLGCVG